MNLLIPDTIGSPKRCPLQRGVRYKEVDFNRILLIGPQNWCPLQRGVRYKACPLQKGFTVYLPERSRGKIRLQHQRVVTHKEAKKSDLLVQREIESQEEETSLLKRIINKTKKIDYKTMNSCSNQHLTLSNTIFYEYMGMLDHKPEDIEIKLMDFNIVSADLNGNKCNICQRFMNLFNEKSIVDERGWERDWT